MGDGNVKVQGDVKGSVVNTGDGDCPLVKNEFNFFSSPPAFPVLGRAPSLLPISYVERSESLASLKERILGSPDGPGGVLAITAIRGLGGAGKSTLANAIAHDPEVRDRFRDGVLWVELGKSPDLLGLLRGWVGRLSRNTNHPTTLQEASDELRWLLADRAVLIVVDNAWKAEHVRPFLVSAEGSQVLVTTRRASVADQIGVSAIPLGGMTPEEALKFLTKRLGQGHVDGAGSDDALRVAEAVGYLPLALDLVASRVSKGITWAKLHKALEQECVQLEVLDPLERRIEACIRLSLDALDATHSWAREAFLSFGILPDEATITAPMTSTLWGVNPDEADLRLELLEDFALLTAPKIRVRDDEWRSYRLHDLVHDYAKSLLGQRPGTPKKSPFAIAHADLLKRYQKRCTQYAGRSGRSKPWHTLPDDGYIHDHLTWHLERAGRIDEIHSLLAEETAEGRNGWFEACDRFGKVDSFLAGVQRAWELADCAVRESTSPIHFERQCRYALIQASIVSLANNIPISDLVALAENRIWPVSKLLAFVRRIRNFVQRAEAAVALARLLDSDSRREVLNAAMPESFRVGDDYEGVEALTLLAPRLDRGQLDEALWIVDPNNVSGIEVVVLGLLAPYLDGDQVRRAREIASGFDLPDLRTRALEALAPYSGDDRNMAIGLVPVEANHIGNHAKQVGVETPSAANTLGDRQRGAPGAVPESARPIGDSAFLREALAILSGDLDGDWLGATLKQARAIVDESVRDAEQWTASMHGLDRDQIKEMMGSAYRYGDVAHIILTEAKDAMSLKRDQRREVLGRALESTLHVHLREQGRAETLAKLAPHLDHDQFGRALMIARSIVASNHRSLALAALAPCLATLPFDQLLSLWIETLHDLVRNGRGELCCDLIALEPVMNELMGSEGFLRIADLIQEVSKFWI